MKIIYLFLHIKFLLMISSLKNRVKWMVLLVVFAIGWISVGSLIVFHQEHVLHKHVDLHAYFFIAPKHKDESVYSVKPVNTLSSYQLMTDHTSLLQATYIVSGTKGLACFRFVGEVPVLDPFFGTPHSLRAPPTC